jgi:RNA-splicing ligase RtcB
MLEIKGLYCNAIVYSENIDEKSEEQIRELCSQPFTQNCKIRVMPDVHAGKGCVIGFTADLGEMVIPNIVGVDIGCGMLTVELGRIDIDFEFLDRIIGEYIPTGKSVHEGRIVKYPNLQNLHCYRQLKQSRRIERSIGTLGGGNHFIEIDADSEGCKYLVIHTGSRNLGKQVAEYYQSLAYDVLCGKDKLFEAQKKLIDEYKAQGRRKEIQAELVKMKNEFQAKTTDVPKELCYLTGEYRQMYLDDMKICQEFATLNRYTIAEIILKHLFEKGIEDFLYFETIHNYIDLKNNIVRKGSVSAQKGERLLIPINMRDGSLICIGKGNEEWNNSAPHGAGRRLSRTQAQEQLSLEEYKEQMNGIYSTCICESTLDESPNAYKTIDEIVSNIEPTADIIKQIKPLYNFKAFM